MGDAAQGKAPTGSMPLLGVSIRVTGNHLRFWTIATKGTMFALGASSPEDANEWAQAMTDHGWYAMKMKEHIENMKNGNEQNGQDEEKHCHDRHHGRHMGHLEGEN